MHYTLNDGNVLPAVGFGTYKLNGTNGVRAMVGALNLGYRLLDAAFNYENEGAVGEAVRQSGIPRSQLIVASKLPGRHHRYQEAIDTIEESLYRAGLDYYDLYLIHWPNPKEGLYVEAWQALIQAQRFGLIRSIGVSNFLPEHIDRLIKETGVTPAVNQVELHPYFNQQTQREYDDAHNIQTVAWSPLGRGAVLKEPVIKQIAAEHGKNVGQVILRWDLQHRVLPIPKSAHLSRQRTNLDIFDFSLTKDEMTAIDQLSKPDGRLRDQDPAVYQEF
ncbi:MULTISPECIES: aldo/keto reductase [Lacticaseibacillus]|uniref:Aldo/keto reductase n=1 Tax=Lacticaseibacillus zeae subsp. silagei TaxID=3068307 RepID=A0ABD7ZBC9_LACZE|nr:MULTISPECIES: aldo/keto reductase [Lacticaseibacillus]OFS01149.1 2,5-diketo-D-gluconic acid reductase [Lactobacillus sp. HMSC068F07]KLI75177.1 2,5-diketo-D-gluconic acid reductase [Lacticaseibacillus casei]MDE3314659.1 aldo/keto reductase [Lacticaseibacillus zeae]WLV84278.1 aldo/keto reductase [Lacticaseibacillus sp. NCIMB 15475]WLV87034.1 aldo/keto reductase [Lacticaseibacillus sp. NCIMB 15474]